MNTFVSAASAAAASPLISVIIPVYNAAAHLRRCLDSVCGQTYQNLEILCVNDGSTDGSLAILEEYAHKDKRVRVFCQANAGQAAARNLALSVARGTWIASVDSDDFIDHDTYDTCMRRLTQPVELIAFGVQIEGNNASRDMRKYFDASNAASGEGGIVPATFEYLCKQADTVWNKLMLRDIIEQSNLRFPEGLWYEDWCFCQMYYCLCRHVCLVPEHLYHYNCHGDSTMGKSQSGHAKSMDRLDVLERIFRFYRDRGLWESKQREVLEQLMSLDTMLRQIRPDKKKEARAKAQNLIRRWHLQKHFARDPLIRELMRPLWLNTLIHLFYQRKRSRTLYKFMGLPLVCLHRIPGRRPYQILGISFGKKIPSPKPSESPRTNA